MGGSAPSKLPGLCYIPLIREPRRRVIVRMCLERATLPDADGNIASVTQVYYKAALNRYSK